MENTQGGAASPAASPTKAVKPPCWLCATPAVGGGGGREGGGRQEQDKALLSLPSGVSWAKLLGKSGV